MAQSSYDESLERLLVHEGGYSNHPSDPGGPTNWGITIEDARRYWKPDATAADVRGMPVEVAKRIYRQRYWDAMRCDALPAGVDYAVFDYGVSSGIGRAAKVLQRLVGTSVDGKIGPLTIAAAVKVNPTKLVGEICDERLAFLQGLSTWSVFGNGWGARVREVRAAALAMAEKAVVPADPRESGGRESRDPVTTAPSVNTGSPLEPAPGNDRGRGRPVVIAWRTALVALIAGAAHFLGAHPLLVAAAVVVGVALAFFVPSNLQAGD